MGKAGVQLVRRDLRAALAGALALLAGAAGVADPFPQAVPAGQVVGAVVLQPVEAQTVVGRVRALVRGGDGGVRAVLHVGGVLGFGGREVAVPLSALVLLGADLQLVGMSAAAVAALPRFDPAGSVVLPADATVRLGLGKPAH